MTKPTMLFSHSSSDKEVLLKRTERDNLNCTPQDGIALAKDVFQHNNFEHRANENYFEGFGLTALTTNEQIRVKPDHALIETTIPLDLEIIRKPDFALKNKH